jgi:DNA primase
MKFQESRDDIAARIKDQADIVKIIGECIDLKKSGTRFLGLCPFHGEKTPSFTVHPGRQFFHCFGCGESGDIFTFMMKYHNLDFPAALKELAARYQIALPEKPRSAAEEKLARKRQAMFTVNDRSAAIYSRYLMEAPGAAAAREYLARRGVSAAVRDRFRIGYAPAADGAGWDFLARQLPAEERRIAEELGLLVKKDNGGSYDRFRDRVLFPILDIRGRVIGFGGRILGDGQPKYMNSPESPVFNKSGSLLGLFQQGESIRRMRQAIVVEGNFDLISLVEHGLGNVVAPLGTALTREQLRLLHRFAEEVILLFDGDSAGQKAAMRAVPLLFTEQMAGRIAILPVGHDPDTFVRQEGAEALRLIVEKAEPLPEFVLATLIRVHGLTLDGKMKIIQELKPIADAAASPLQRSVVLAHFSEKLGLPAGQVESLWTAGSGTSELPRQQSAGPTTGGLDHERETSLSGAQRHLVNFMVLHPRFFPKLEAAGLRDFLGGTVGEVLFLQMQAILAQKDQIEPEELLSLLPEGAERGLVSDLLIKAAGQSDDPLYPTSPEAEFEDLVGWLRNQVLRRKSLELQKKILLSQQLGDIGMLQLLMVEKQEVDRQLQGVEG